MLVTIFGAVQVGEHASAAGTVLGAVLVVAGLVTTLAVSRKRRLR
jgi:hypothetical protein